jgi:hypothetical protein
MLSRSLVVHEEEELVAEDRAAEGTTEHGTVERSAWCASQFRSPCVCVQVLVLSKEKSIAVELIGSAFGDHNDLAAVCVAILCGGVAGDDADFPESVYVRAVADVVVDGFVDVGAVKGVVVALFTIAVDVESAVILTAAYVIQGLRIW